MKESTTAFFNPAPLSPSASDLLRRLVDLASHRTGSVARLMEEAGVTLRQVLLLDRAQALGSAALRDFGADALVSAAALSQMVDRLVRQGLLSRSENAVDRRRKAIRVTPRARALLRRIEAARTKDYELGLGALSNEARNQLALALEQAVGELERSRLGGGLLEEESDDG
ncbi:MAG: MarR family transcriptional regulator [Roseiarcus sp.]